MPFNAQTPVAVVVMHHLYIENWLSSCGKQTMKTHLKASLWLAIATLLLALGCSGSIAYFDKTSLATAARDNSRVIVDGAQNLPSEQKDAETGSRGYRITRGDAFFQPSMDVCDCISRVQA